MVWPGASHCPKDANRCLGLIFSSLRSGIFLQKTSHLGLETFLIHSEFTPLTDYYLRGGCRHSPPRGCVPTSFPKGMSFPAWGDRSMLCCPVGQTLWFPNRGFSKLFSTNTFVIHTVGGGLAWGHVACWPGRSKVHRSLLWEIPPLQIAPS